jgi:AraC-like DNA-binding protein/mannose-6-phosphate isomerase-like protein (cupin superfamily)
MMLYTLAERIMPAYYRDYYSGDYSQIRRNPAFLSSNPITALHYHKCVELGICLRGRGITYVDNRKYNYSTGDLQVMPAGVPHLSMAEKGIPTEWFWISFEPLRILKESGICHYAMLEEMAQKSYCGIFHPWEYPQLAELIYKFRDVPLDKGAETDMACTFLAGQLLQECARIGDVDYTEKPLTSNSVKVMPAVLHIRQNYGDKELMREEVVAGTCYMSTSHFRAVFKKETGMTVRDFIIQTRLVAAAHLLKNTDSSIMDIAAESGFGQVSCFNRSFLKAFGQTPTAFRKKSRAQVEVDYMLKQQNNP